MRPRTFLAFIAPSFVLMALFIALPLGVVFWQSFHVDRGVFRTVEVESCAPGFLTQVCTKETRSEPVRRADGSPLTERQFVGFEAYQYLLRPDAVAAAFSKGWAGFDDLLGLDFYRALRFTLTFTFLTLPFVIGLGLVLALATDAALKAIRGPVIFVSLLPYVITPVVGALALRWLFIGDGVLSAWLALFLGYKFQVFAHGWAIEILMMFYRVWHVAPFAFIIFYAGLQTVDQETLEYSVIDGATRFQRLRYIVIPHLMPLVVFVTLIHLMDTYRVFEEIVGFASQAHRISLQYLTYQYLTPDYTGNRAIARASASAMLTMLGVIVLLIPILVRTWREHYQKA
jgi:multiple sugar transport system permease protein